MRRACARCGAHLAADNTAASCSPCWNAELERSASGALRHRADEEVVATAFGRGGVPAIADVLGCPLGDALDLALLGGLVPSPYRRRYQVLLRLLQLGPQPHVSAATQLGLSRWTVATYRQVLGLSERGPGTPERRPPRAAAARPGQRGPGRHMPGSREPGRVLDRSRVCAL